MADPTRRRGIPEPDVPRGRVFDMGVIDLPSLTEGSNNNDNEAFVEIEMPFDGFIYRLDPQWEKGAENAIGFNIHHAGDILIPSNYGKGEDESEFFVGDSATYPLFPIEPAEEGDDIMAQIENRSTNEELDLQLTLQVLNFDPRRLSVL